MIKIINKYACSVILFLIWCLIYLAWDAYFKINSMHKTTNEINSILKK